MHVQVPGAVGFVAVWADKPGDVPDSPNVVGSDAESDAPPCDRGAAGAAVLAAVAVRACLAANFLRLM